MTGKNLEEWLEKDIDIFIGELNALDSADDKLQKMLDYMQLQLEKGKVKPINRFWKMRHFCLDQFKQNISFSKRLAFWGKYCEIIEEINHLRAVIEEKVLSNKVEIEKAILSIEKEIGDYSELLLNSPPIEIPQNVTCFQKNETFYQTHQKELNIFNSYAKQLNALKNEALKLEISYRDKQKLLDELHALSDRVFPRKRDLLIEISKAYSEDLKHFIQQHFEKKELKLPLFNIKDQIKSLQNFSKVLNLNVATFTQSREKLSECWDQIRNFEKEQKKVKDQQKVEFQENETQLGERIEALKEKKVALSKEAYEREVNQLDESIKKANLQKSQRNKLREHLSVIDQNSNSNENSSEGEEVHVQIQREIQNLNVTAKNKDYFTLMAEYKRIQALFISTPILDAHQNKILRGLFSIKNILVEKLLDEVENGVDAESLAEEIEGFKKEIREDIERYRRALNTSNQSIEKAMLFNELLTQSKIKLSEFESKIKSKFSSKEF